MKRGFLSQKGSRVGRGVKEKQVSMANKSVEVDEHGNVALGSNSTTQTIDMNVGLDFSTVFEGHGIHSPASANEENINNVGTMVQPTLVGITFGISSCANVIGKPSRKVLKFCTLFTSGKTGSSYARAMIKLWADVELKDTIVVAMPKLTEEGFYTCIVRVEYEWKPPRCACCKVFGHIQEECPKNPGLRVEKNLKKPSQASKGVSVGLKVGFKPAKEYRPVLKKPTANTSGIKKKWVEPTKEFYF
ncbi:hypothetical protein Tco_1125382 [Tanacetum coccineum]|uniref:Zinc knuckle CX2CX4HX4C n=1 Tax=Tanacetum coccineum TaxID=301880 RepID=A0ABQ5J8V0_9ASTR